MHRAHHVEPLISRTLRRNSLAHFVIENFRAAAGKTVESGFFEPRHDRFVIEFRDQMDVVDLGRREAVQLEVRIFFTERTQQVFVPLNAEVRVESALHEDAGAAERDRLVDLLADLFEAADVSVRGARTAIERAESADNVTDIRVVDVAIDDVRDDVIEMMARAYLIRSRTHTRYVVRFEQGCAFLNAHALTCEDAIENWLNVRHRCYPWLINLSGFTRSIKPCLNANSK